MTTSMAIVDSRTRFLCLSFPTIILLVVVIHLIGGGYHGPQFADGGIVGP
jgi:hypothetical protein